MCVCVFLDLCMLVCYIVGSVKSTVFWSGVVRPAFYSVRITSCGVLEGSPLSELEQRDGVLCSNVARLRDVTWFLNGAH